MEGRYTLEYVYRRDERFPDCSLVFSMAGILDQTSDYEYSGYSYADSGYGAPYEFEPSALTDPSHFEKAPGLIEAEGRWWFGFADWRAATVAERQVRRSVVFCA